MNRIVCLCSFILGIALTAAISGCNGGSGSSSQLIVVSIAAPIVDTMQPGQTAAIVAQVANDSSNQGVTWSVSCSSAACGAVSPTSTASSASTTYTAPGAPLASTVTVTITATSVANPAKSASKVMSVLMSVSTTIAVTLVASATPVPAGGASVITATVTGDPANQGVNPSSWSISPATGAGTLSKATSTSVTYTAPATPPPADVQVTITASAQSNSTQSGGITIAFAAIAVALTAGVTSLEIGGTSTISAAVSFDSANAGINPASWAITSPSSGGGTLSSPTNNSVVYTAPSTPPGSNLAVTISAVAASDSTKSGSITMTVLAVTISVSPASALIPVSTGSQQFIATIRNDPATPPQDTWSLLQSGTVCASACGAFSVSTTASGTATTYTPPASVVSSPMVMINATSVTDTTKTASATITLSSGTAQIVPYALEFGSIKVNQSKSLATLLTNTGASTLTISSVAITGSTSQFTIANDACGSSLAAGSNCQITVTFKAANAGAYSGVLSITDSSTDSPQQVSLSGTARASRLAVSPAAVASALARNKAPSVPVPTGPNRVGTRVLDLVDFTRNDIFLGNGTKRELLVRLWYPAATDEECVRAEYTSRSVWSEFARLAEVADLPQVTTNSCRNSRIAPGTHPVVMFTPGYTGTFTDYTFLFEDLASRGYVVASVDHTFEATAAEFPDGRVAKSVFGSHLGAEIRNDLPAMELAVATRLSDLQFVLDKLELLNAGADAQLAGALDTTRVALAGHSLGGLTTILEVAREPRFRAGIVLDGMMPNFAPPDIQTPMLILAAGRDTWSDAEQLLWASLHGERLAVNLRGAEHVTPSDLLWLAPGAVRTGTMGTEKTIAVIRSYTAAFLEANVLGKAPDVLLTQPPSEFPDVVLTTRDQMLRPKN